MDRTEQKGLVQVCMVLLLVRETGREVYVSRRDGCGLGQKGLFYASSKDQCANLLERETASKNRRNWFSMGPKGNGGGGIPPSEKLNIVPLRHPKGLLL